MSVCHPCPFSVHVQANSPCIHLSSTSVFVSSWMHRPLHVDFSEKSSRVAALPAWGIHVRGLFRFWLGQTQDHTKVCLLWTHLLVWKPFVFLLKESESVGFEFGRSRDLCRNLCYLWCYPTSSLSLLCSWWGTQSWADPESRQFSWQSLLVQVRSGQDQTHQCEGPLDAAESSRRRGRST